MTCIRVGWARVVVGPASALAATSTLWALLQRSFGRTALVPDLLMLGVIEDFGAAEWTLLLAVATACSRAVLKADRRALLHVQAWSLAAGLFLTHYHLGSEAGKKVDLRFVFGLIAGVASLHACSICLIGHAALSLRLWRLQSR